MGFLSFFLSFFLSRSVGLILYIAIYLGSQARADEPCTKYVQETLEKMYYRDLINNRRNLGIPYKLYNDASNGLSLQSASGRPNDAGYFSKFSIKEIKNENTSSTFKAVLKDDPRSGKDELIINLEKDKNPSNSRR